MSNVKKYKHSDLTWVNGFDAGTVASIAAIAAPGAGKRIMIKSFTLNTLTADAVIMLSGATEKSRYYFPANGGIDKDFGESPILLGVNEALNFTKTLATTMSWSVMYSVV